MTVLTFLHLAVHPLRHLPSFRGLVNLKALTLVVLLDLEEVPSFESLHHLQRLELSALPRVQLLPDFAPIHRLLSFNVADQGVICCNGFLDGHCNLSHPLCTEHPLWGTPSATCVDSSQRAPPATRNYFDQFNTTACYGPPFVFSALNVMAPEKSSTDWCNGQLYKQCQFPGYNGPAMCYNTRWMAISCDPSPSPIEMRRQQIALGVGQPCERRARGLARMHAIHLAWFAFCHETVSSIDYRMQCIKQHTTSVCRTASMGHHVFLYPLGCLHSATIRSSNAARSDSNHASLRLLAMNKRTFAVSTCSYFTT